MIKDKYMAHIEGGEFPDDELTDITYMLESNDNFDELLHDLNREDDGNGTKVRIGPKRHLLANVIRVVEALRDSGSEYPEKMKDYVETQL